MGDPDLIFKPRNQWHTFWNAGDTPARVLDAVLTDPRIMARFAEVGSVPKSMTPAGYIPEEQPEVLAAKMIEFFEQDGR
jgi:hypothetical protein